MPAHTGPIHVRTACRLGEMLAEQEAMVGLAKGTRWQKLRGLPAIVIAAPGKLSPNVRLGRHFATAFKRISVSQWFQN